MRQVKKIKTLQPKTNQIFKQAFYEIGKTESCKPENSKIGLPPTEGLLNHAANENFDSNEESTLFSNQAADSMSQEMHWVSLNDDIPNVGKDDSNLAYRFSPCFLEMCSIAFANSREIAKSDFCSSHSIEFTQIQVSRNKLHVMCAMTMMLQRQHVAITKHDGDLPPWPRNEKQFYAARYRRSQLRILHCVSESILGELKGMAGINSSKARDARVVRLEHILMESPAGLSTDYRAALNAGLGTRSAAKIRNNGWVQCAFTIWLCGLWLWNSKNLQRKLECSNSELPDKISRWLRFLRCAYGNPPILEFDESQSDRLKDGNEFEKSEFNLSIDSTSLARQRDDKTAVVESYFAIIKAAVKKHPTSIFASPDVTVVFLMWCLDIIEAEGIMFPNLEGKIGDENDEFILFLEDSIP